jgi:hypothetical protein
MPGETVVYRARLSLVALKGLPWAVILAIIAIFSHDYRTMLFVASALFALGAYLQYNATEFGVTNRRVIAKVGVIRTRSFEILLPKIEGIAVDQGLGGKMNDYGSVMVTGTGGNRETFRDISHPFKFREAVQEQIEARTSG